MLSTLVVVDGPNLYNDAARYLADEEQSLAPVETQHRYFKDWFDIDRVVLATLPQSALPDLWTGLGTVIFRSPKALGNQSSRLGGGDLDAFWARQGTNPGASTMRVDIPGATEKGVDTSMVVYLFETADRWDQAVLFTNDSDFVPAVWALRRRGKRVFCAAPHRDHSPLAEACQNFLPWCMDFLRDDRALCETVQPGGVLDTFLARSENLLLEPQVRVISSGLLLDAASGTFTQRECEDLNGLLRGSNLLAELVGSRTLHVRTRPRPGDAAPVEYNANVCDGLRRHPNVFASATWAARLDR